MAVIIEPGSIRFRAGFRVGVKVRIGILSPWSSGVPASAKGGMGGGGGGEGLVVGEGSRVRIMVMVRIMVRARVRRGPGRW